MSLEVSSNRMRPVWEMAGASAFLMAIAVFCRVPVGRSLAVVREALRLPRGLRLALFRRVARARPMRPKPPQVENVRRTGAVIGQNDPRAFVDTTLGTVELSFFAALRDGWRATSALSSCAYRVGAGGVRSRGAEEAMDLGRRGDVLGRTKERCRDLVVQFFCGNAMPGSAAGNESANAAAAKMAEGLEGAARWLARGGPTREGAIHAFQRWFFFRHYAVGICERERLVPDEATFRRLTTALDRLGTLARPYFERVRPNFYGELLR